jgi:hypothetical protein
MTAVTQNEKRHRAATFPGTGPAAGIPNSAYGPLDVLWESGFDRMCYLVSGVDLAIKNAKRYRRLMDQITSATGCTEEEVLAHGDKVRAILFFAHDKLEKQGALRELSGKSRLEYRLAPVAPVF